MAEEAEIITRAIDVGQERQKPRLVAILFYNFANETSDGKANLLGIFDRIFVHPEVKKTPRFGLFIRTVETAPDTISVRIFDPDGELNTLLPYEPGEMPSHGKPFNVHHFGYIILETPKEGVYWFDVMYKGESLGGAGLVIEFREGNKVGGTDTYV